ncbi:MAG: xanthine dehydrogenase family protein molybdopterin-binding subunit [Chloroflexi bacterium]|nr:xanthine dehydrogenase family protein molybdopterin-binding subunit [Chloroflexota bacterium]
MPYIGQSIKRFEDPRLVAGQGSYVDDITVPGMLHAAFLRSPYAHARIRSVDASVAREMPGVVAVLTGDDIVDALPDLPSRAMTGEWSVDEFNGPEHPALAIGKVCYVGQPVAIVVAQEPSQARDALETIQTDYEPLTAIMDPWEAASPDSIPVHSDMGTNVALRIHHDRQGKELDDAFAQADLVVRQRYDVQRLAPVPMETRGLLAHSRPEDGSLTIWASTQGAHRVQRQIARLLDRAEDTIRVIAPDVGGGFGEKGGVFPEDLAVCYLSVKLGRPIKWVADRQENMLGFHGRGHSVDVEAAVRNDGTILGIRLQIIGDGGAYFANSTPGPPYRASHRIIGPYTTPAARIEVLGVVTNKPPTGAYRGAGGPEAAFCMERTVDLVAQELGMDPAELRRKNFIPDDAFPYETPTGLLYDSGSYEAVLDRALALSDYSGWRERAALSKSGDGPLIGVGLATVIKMSGGSGDSRSEEAWLKIEPSGQITALTGVSPHGQGSATAFAQIVADQLGVGPQDVQVLHGDTAIVPSGGGTGATRGSVVGGSALHLVSQKARHKLSVIAAHMLQCDREDLEFEDGRAYHRRDAQRSVSFLELAAAAHDQAALPPGMPVGLDFSDSFTLGEPYQSPHAFSTHVVVVEVSRETGDTKILKYVAVHDCGRIINPMLVEGQVHGGIVQGIGQALWEGMAYSPDGQPYTGSLLDYALPQAKYLPELTTDTMETPSPMNPLGIKGVGELPTVAAPAAVANAVMDALSGYGVRHIDTPLTPEKVWRAMQGEQG